MHQDSPASVRVGVVGLGSFGQLHALTLAQLAEAQLVAVVDPKQARLDTLAEPLSQTPGWTDLDKAIIESGAQAWIVACSTDAHVAVAGKLLAAGKCVLLEKPIAATRTEAEQLQSWVKADSSNLMLGHIMLFNSEFRTLLAEAQRRGPIVYVDCVRHRPTTTMQLYPGESPLHLTMVHDLYMLLALTQRARPSRFAAQTHRSPGGACDLVTAQLGWEDGGMASLTASFMTPEGMAEDGFDRMEVFGKQWAARITPNPRPIEVWDDRARWPMALEINCDSQAISGMLCEELRHFCRVVRGQASVPMGATYEDALQIQRWIERLETAAQHASQ